MHWRKAYGRQAASVHSVQWAIKHTHLQLCSKSIQSSQQAVLAMLCYSLYSPSEGDLNVVLRCLK